MAFSTRPIIAISIVIALLTQVANAQNSSPLPTPVEVTSAEGITEYKLDNGMHVLLFPDQSKSNITVNITYLVGSRMEGYGETGMAHLLEHMLFKGSVHHPNVPQELTAHGADFNGTTSYDRTNYYETFVATDSNLLWALSLESDRMINSFIAKKDLESEFSVVRNEFEMGENYPSHVLRERVLSTAYLWHNYGKATIGSKDDIEKVPIENLQAFYRKYYQPDNAVLVVTGKIDEAKTLTLVNEYFGKTPRPTRIIQEPYTREPVQDGERSCELRRTGDVQVVSCGYHICNGAHPDYAALQVLIDVLDNEPSGRLYKALVETKKSSEMWGYAQPLKDPGYVYFSADVLKDKSLEDAKRTMLNLLDSLKYNPVTKEETERGKNKILSGLNISYNNSATVGLVLSNFIAMGDWRLWFLYRNRVEKVTADDVNRVIATYFKPSNRTVGLFIPENNPDRAQIPNNPAMDTTLQSYKPHEKLADAEVFDASPDNIDKRTETGTIAGGAKYALLQKTTRGGTVVAQINLRIGSKLSLSNKAKLTGLTADMLMNGTTTKTRQQINDEIDKLKAKIYISGSGQHVSIHVKTDKENLPGALKLVDDMIRHPSFPANEFDKLVESSIADIDQERNDPQSITSNTFRRLTNLYPKDDFRYTKTFDEQATDVKAVKLDDIKKFYADYYNSTSATISVIGDFDVKEVKSELITMLENWKSPVKYERAQEPYFAPTSTMQRINVPDKTNATLQAGYNFEMRDDDPDYQALQLGNYMLGGGALSSRLAERIRQKEGISYGVASWLYAEALDKTGEFGTWALFNPDNIDKLLAAYKEEINKVITEGFTADEIKDARPGLLQERKVARGSDDRLVYTLNENLFLNRTMQREKKEDEEVSNLTLEQVNSAMKKWLKPDKITIVVAGDFDRKKASESK